VIHPGKVTGTNYAMEIFWSAVELSKTDVEKDLVIGIMPTIKSSLHHDKAADTSIRILWMLKGTLKRIVYLLVQSLC